MRITEIRLKNFKRFADLTIANVPSAAKLVVVVGPNGSGKSSLFDAFLHWHRLRTNRGWLGDKYYLAKDQAREIQIMTDVEITLADGGSAKEGGLYVRSAYRNDADLEVTQFEAARPAASELRVQRLIDDDKTVKENYSRLLLSALGELFAVANDAKTVAMLRDELIGKLRDSMTAVFGDLIVNSLADPFAGGTFTFDKGDSKAYRYKNLSGGEKAAFGLLLDLHIKTKYHPDSIYCIDELETHLHTRVQGKLLREVMKVIPDEAQLWVTTHSLGVLRAAQEISKEQPGSVAVIDFDVSNPDLNCEISPTDINRLSWEKMLSVALDDLAVRVAPKSIVVCEGSSVGSRRKNFDADIYNKILASQQPDILFVSGGSSSQIAQFGHSVRQTFSAILPSTNFRPLCDRDDKSDVEVREFEASGGIVLSLRNLESYLLDDEIVTELVQREGKQSLLEEVLQMKEVALQASVARGNAPNDLKSASGEIYNGLRRLLNLVNRGNNSDAFLRDTMAPLVVPPTAIYAKLKTDITDKVDHS